ncbi:unnamed protein product [Dicrocoelium dendriticum]|nr:unnamed protein product [Dicrocoelium dendriticum]
MGIFALLKTSIASDSLKLLNEYLKFNTRLEESRFELEFLNECVQANRYPKHFWREIRRCGLYPNAKSLKRHALNYVDSVRIKMSELERFISQRLPAVLRLPEDLRQPFEEYVELVKQKMGVRKQK